MFSSSTKLDSGLVYEMLWRIASLVQAKFTRALVVGFEDAMDTPYHPYFFLSEETKYLWGIIRNYRELFSINESFYGGAYGRRAIECGVSDSAIIDEVRSELQRFALQVGATRVNLRGLVDESWVPTEGLKPDYEGGSGNGSTLQIALPRKGTHTSGSDPATWNYLGRNFCFPKWNRLIVGNGEISKSAADVFREQGTDLNQLAEIFGTVDGKAHSDYESLGPLHVSNHDGWTKLAKLVGHTIDLVVVNGMHYPIAQKVFYPDGKIECYDSHDIKRVSMRRAEFRS